jgi:hypothetical protein
MLLASAAGAEMIYKYRLPDGQTIYSNRTIPGVELIDAFEYKFAEPAPASKDATKNAAEAEARIKAQLDALQAAWTEVQDSTRELAAAEERLRAGAEPREGDWQSLWSPAKPAPPAVGGPQSGRRGRASPEYAARLQALEAEVNAARARLDAALRRYNDLR